jgi:hypothetical protein
LKQMEVDFNNTLLTGRPRVGAWIENIHRGQKERIGGKSPPRVGAWIEP